jgi:preprotein translocase subunit SecG
MVSKQEEERVDAGQRANASFAGATTAFVAAIILVIGIVLSYYLGQQATDASQNRAIFI